MRAVLLVIAWVVPLAYALIPVYWFLVHPFAARWRRVQRPHLYIVPLWLLGYLVAGILTLPYSRTQLYNHWTAWLAGGVLVVAAFATYRSVGTKHITGAQIVGSAELNPDREQRLVTTGAHARIRHPLYAAALLMVLGWTIGSGLLADYLLLGFALVFFPVMIALEECELEQRFGEAYREYKRRVPAIIPRLGQQG